MAYSLLNKTYAIAGGSKGIGLSLTKQLLADGAVVHVYARTAGDLPKHDDLFYHEADFLSDDLPLADLPEELNGAAYCPGSINLRSFRSLSLETFRQDFEINTLGAIKFLKGCLAGLKKEGKTNASSIVLFSTVAVQTGLPMHTSIASAKGAVEGLTRSLAAEFAPHIRVNCLAPGLTDTPLACQFFSTREKQEAMDAKYPLKRAGRPEDIAHAASFLLSDKSDWITGQILGIDGGMASIAL